YLFGIPDMQAEETKYAIGIPKLGSLILTHSMDGKVTGLKEFAPEDRPNSLVVFWSFRIMVGLGMLMLLLALWGLWSRSRGRVYGHAPACTMGAMLAYSGTFLGVTWTASVCTHHGSIRISCHAGRMVYHRSRPAALGCLRHYADQRCIITSVR